MDKHVFLLCIILLVSSASIGIDLMQESSQEGFDNAGKYPVSIEKPLLKGFYKEKEEPKLTTNEAADIYKNYPIFSSDSMRNNNIDTGINQQMVNVVQQYFAIHFMKKLNTLFHLEYPCGIAVMYE